MVYKYKVIDEKGEAQEGTIDAVSVDVAISSLQRKGYVISAITPLEQQSFFQTKFTFLQRVSNKDIVVLSRQMAILFEAQVSALRVFRLLGGENDNAIIRTTLNAVGDDLQAGSSISVALSKHKKVFSEFYVNMVRSGEESGKLDEIFGYLADYLDRTYEVTSKARNALIYPCFVVITFIVVMLLMFTLVIPKISGILVDSGTQIPIYTKIILAISNFLVSFWWILLILVIVGAFFTWRYARTPQGEIAMSRLKITTPYIGNLYRKLYLSRISDNMNTMLLSGIPMIKTLEVSAEVVGNRIYRNILIEASESVKAGQSVSQSLSRFPEIPGIMIQMMKVGEETGQLGSILKTMAKFYQREVNNAVDTLIDLIEPAMIVFLGAGVGILLASVLVPIYSISSSF
jgi:type IV pilus assembly protein PilC